PTVSIGTLNGQVEISASSTGGNGNGGSISISAINSLNIDGAGLHQLGNGGFAQGGSLNITLNGPQTTLNTTGTISVDSGGGFGSIHVQDNGSAIMNFGFLSANGTGFGNGGQITVTGGPGGSITVSGDWKALGSNGGNGGQITIS